MIMKPDIAPWFFSSELCACDIFNVISPTAGENPIVIHPNLNKYGNKFIKNLQEKGETVDQMIVARVYSEIPSQVKVDALDYFIICKGERPCTSETL